jgi:hypothetical protein
VKIQNIERTVAKKRQKFLCILPKIIVCCTRYGIFPVQNVATYGHIGRRPSCFPLFFAHFFPAGKIGVAPEGQIWYNRAVLITKTANSALLKERKRTMRPDTRSLLHGIFNLILPLFAYDLAGLLVFSLTAGDYTPWLSVWPMRILTYLPFLSDLIGVIVGWVRYARRGRTRALLGIIFSVGGAALYFMLRFHLGFTLFGMLV